jgi:uridine kinase
MPNPTSPVKLVGITGGSCSGKTTLENNLATRFNHQFTFFPFDDMFVGMEALAGQTITDWEDPNLYRWDDFIPHLHDLKNGHPVTITANSQESVEEGITSRFIQPRSIVTVVGFLALHHPEARQIFDTTIYLDVPEEVIIQRRLARANPDNPWDSTEYINNKLIPGHRRVVVPQRNFAAYIIDATMPPEQVANKVADKIQQLTVASPAIHKST